MDYTKPVNMREDKQLLMLTHLTGISGLFVPLFIWITQKDKVLGMDTHGKMILNFQISIFILSILALPLIFLFGTGFFVLAALAIAIIVFPVLNARKVDRGEIPAYPALMKFIK